MPDSTLGPRGEYDKQRWIWQNTYSHKTHIQRKKDNK